MRKWVVAGVALLLLCALLGAGLLNLNGLVKRNRDFLLSQAERALGRKITAGDIELTIMSGIGLQVKDFALADDPSFSSGDFVRAKDLQVNVKFWPLLKREFEIKSVLLRRPVIAISRNALGDYNFSSLGGKGKEKEAREERLTKDRPKGVGDASISGVAIYLANIADGELIYRDQKERIDLTLKQVDLTVSEAAGNQTLSVEMDAALFAAKRNLKLETKVGPILRGADINRLHWNGSIEIDPLDIEALQTAVPGIGSLLPKEWQWSGTLSINKAKFNGTLENLAVNGAVNATRAAIRMGKNFNKAPGIPLEISANAQFFNQTLHIRNADLKLHTLAANSKGEVQLGEGASVNLALDVKPSALGGWEKIVPAAQPYQLSGTVEVHALVRGKIGKGAAPDLQGNATLTGASVKAAQLPMPVKNLNSKVVFKGQKLETKDSSFDLGSSKMRLTASIDRFSPLAVSYALATPEIRPADFQGAVAEERKSDVFRNLTSAGSLTVQEGKIVLKGNLASSDGTLRRIAYQKLEAQLGVADQVAHVRNLRVNAFGGGVAGEGEVAFGETVPRFSLAAKIQGVDMNEFYRSLSAQTQRDLHGRLSGSAQLAGSGRNWEEIKPNLQGQGEVEIVQGALLNFNLVDAALSSAAIPGLGNLINPQLRKKYPETFESKDTRFKEMRAHFDLADGRINVKDLRVTATDYSLEGEGSARFERRINFRTALILSPALSADLAQSLREARFLFNKDNQFTMPFTVTGTLPRVKTKPDSSALAKMFQRGAGRRGTDELQRKFFGGKDAPATQDGESADEEPRPTRKKRSTEDLIRKGIEGLFKR